VLSFFCQRACSHQGWNHRAKRQRCFSWRRGDQAIVVEATEQDVTEGCRPNSSVTELAAACKVLPRSSETVLVGKLSDIESKAIENSASTVHEVVKKVAAGVAAAERLSPLEKKTGQKKQALVFQVTISVRGDLLHRIEVLHGPEHLFERPQSYQGSWPSTKT
jgi:hypothetical protein